MKMALQQLLDLSSYQPSKVVLYIQFTDLDLYLKKKKIVLVSPCIKKKKEREREGGNSFFYANYNDYNLLRELSF